jgi:hypothetical protein
MKKPPDFAYVCKISQLIISETAKPEIFTAKPKTGRNIGLNRQFSGSAAAVRSEKGIFSA